MKNIIYPIFFLSIIVMSCSEQDNLYLSSEKFSQHSNTIPIRSYQEALELAQSSISILDNSPTTRGIENNRKINLSEGDVITIDAKTRGLNHINDTLIYVFNFEENEGFVLVSASKETEGILAVTEKGHFVSGEPSGIDGYDMFVDLAKDYVINNSFWPIDSMIDIFDEYLYIHHYTGPYVSVQWGQNYAEGELCQNGLSGCGATAMAQVMTHFEYPTSMSYTYPDPDITSQTLDWSSIKSHNTMHYLSNCSTENMDTHKSISRLCRQLGQIAQSEYAIGGYTSTYVSMIKSTMQYYGYNTSDWENYNSGNVCNKLDDGEVIIMYGNNNGENGHFWIVDGYDDLEYYIYTYMYVHGRDHAELTDIFGPFTETLNHINWGWYGINNGYFSVNVFNTSYVQFPDTNNNYANLTFNNALMTLSVSLE